MNDNSNSENLKASGIGVLGLLGVLVVIGIPCGLGSLLATGGSQAGVTDALATNTLAPTYIPVPTFTPTPGRLFSISVTVSSIDAGTTVPTETPIPPTPLPPTTEPPTATPSPRPMVTINSAMNVRGGPDTNYPIIGTASPGQQFQITGKNPGGDWWQIVYQGKPGWVYEPLVNATNSVSVETVHIPPTPVTVATWTPTPAQAPLRRAIVVCAIEGVPEPPFRNLDCETWETSYILWSLELGVPAPASQLSRIATEIYPALEASAQACGVSPMQFGLYIHAAAEQLKEEGKPSSSPNTPIAYLIGYFETFTVTGVLKETVQRTGGCVETLALLTAMIE